MTRRRELGEALNLFATLDPTHLYVHFVQVFLVIADEGMCTYRKIEERLGLSNSAVSRTVQALGAVNRNGREGFGLVKVERDPAEGRRLLAMLTSKGEALLRQLEGEGC